MKSNKRCCWKLCCSNETVKRHSATQFEITVKWHSATQFEITVKWHSAENIVMTQCYTRCGSMSRPMMMSSISKRISRMSSLTVMRVEFTDSTRGRRSTHIQTQTYTDTYRQTDRHRQTDTAHSLWWELSLLIAHSEREAPSSILVAVLTARCSSCSLASRRRRASSTDSTDYTTTHINY